MYVVKCFKLFLGISYCNFFRFYLRLFTAIFIKYGANCLCDLKKHVTKLYQYSSIVFNLHYKELCDRLPASQYHLGRNSWFATSCTLERSFSMQGKLLAKDHRFSPNNVCKYLALYANKSLAKITVV